MSNFSLPADYSTISNDTITIDSYNTIDISSITGNSITYVTAPSYTYSPSMNSGLTVGGTYTPSISTVQIGAITSIDTSAFTFNIPEEWVGTFPAWDRVDNMCKKYPALEIALRNFKTVYQLVKDDYDNPTPKK
jgi:hypothetical protein